MSIPQTDRRKRRLTRSRASNKSSRYTRIDDSNSLSIRTIHVSVLSEAFTKIYGAKASTPGTASLRLHCSFFILCTACISFASNRFFLHLVSNVPLPPNLLSSFTIGTVIIVRCGVFLRDYGRDPRRWSPFLR